MIVLLGGTGLLGRQVLRKLLERKYPVRLFVRGSSDWKDASILDLKRKGVELTIADIADAKAISRSLDGVTAVINLVGTIIPSHQSNLRLLHVDALNSLIKIAQKRDIERFIHVGCLGANATSDCEYLLTKWESEALMRTSPFLWTIFRPSYLFGERFPLLDLLMPLVKFKWCMPVPGSGVNPIQPVWVDDVADCIVDSIYAKATVYETYELAGPKTYGIGEIMEMARRELGIGGPVFNIPSATAARASAAIGKMIPKSAVSEEVIRLFMSKSSTDENALGTKFKVRHLPLEDLFSKIMDSY